MRIVILAFLVALLSTAFASSFAAADVGGDCDYENGVREDAATLAVDAACEREHGGTCYVFGEVRVLQYGTYGCFIAA